MVRTPEGYEIMIITIKFNNSCLTNGFVTPSNAFVSSRKDDEDLRSLKEGFVDVSRLCDETPLEEGPVLFKLNTILLLSVFQLALIQLDENGVIYISYLCFSIASLNFLNSS